MRNALHEVTVLFQLRWMTRVALGIAFASLCLLLVVRKVFLTELGPSFGKAVQTMRTLDHLLLPTVSFSILFFILVAGVVVAVAISLVSHRLVRPIFRAEEFAEGLHRGDLRTPTPVHGDDQLRGFSSEIDRLHGSLVSEVREIGDALARIELLWEKLDNASPTGTTESALEIFQRMQRELDTAAAGRHSPTGES